MYGPDVSDSDFTAEFAEDLVLNAVLLLRELLQSYFTLRHVITDRFDSRLITQSHTQDSHCIMENTFETQ